tara:strand:- start:269 stop:511 length:243 start_codon:yes stop_codon:yes gene_type:complete
MKNAMNLVQIYQNIDEIIYSSVTDKSIKADYCMKLIDLRTEVHRNILDAVDDLTSNQQKDIFDKLNDIRNDSLATIKNPL